MSITLTEVDLLAQHATEVHDEEMEASADAEHRAASTHRSVDHDELPRVPG